MNGVPMTSVLLATLLLLSSGLAAMPLVIISVAVAYVASERLTPSPAPAMAEPPAPVETAATTSVGDRAEHLAAVAPWHVPVEFEREYAGAPFTGTVEGPAFDAMAEAMQEVYGRELTLQGDGGSIPLCNLLHETFPDADIMLLGVEEPLCRIHGPNEGVDPSEIENMALVEALFLQKYAARRPTAARAEPTE
jgi:cysteinylglycine-S-conjugate dipeptidase